MNLDKKVPPPIVTLIFATLIYLTEYSYQFHFAYQSIISLIIAFIGIVLLLLLLFNLSSLKPQLIL